MAQKRKITGNAKKLTRKVAKGLGIAIGKTKGTTSRKILADEVRAAKPLRSKTGMSGRHFEVYQKKRTLARANLAVTLRSNHKRVMARVAQAAKRQAPTSSHLAASVHKKFGSAGVHHLAKTQGVVKHTTGLASRVAARKVTAKVSSGAKGKLLKIVPKKTAAYHYLPTRASARHLAKLGHFSHRPKTLSKTTAVGVANRKTLATWIKANRHSTLKF
jgi:hypothetical protein